MKILLPILLLFSIYIYCHGQNVMVLSEDNITAMSMKSSSVKDSSAISDVELEIMYKFRHCRISDTTSFFWTAIKVLYGNGVAVQIDMNLYWNARLKDIAMDKIQGDYEKTKLLKQMSGNKESNLFLSMIAYYNIGDAEVICGDFFKSDRSFRYNENLKKMMNWNIGNETATICGYMCHNATISFKGREWKVWFTPEIPVPVGPWKLGWLPGLIVRAESTDGYYSFSVMSVNEISGKLYSYNYGLSRKLKSCDDWLIYQKNCFETPLFVFGNGEDCYVMVKKNSGETEFLNESWSIPYLCPIENH